MNLCSSLRERDWHTQVKYDSEIPWVQIDFQFISGVAVCCPEAHCQGHCDEACGGEKVPHSVTLVQPPWSQSIVQSIKVLEEVREHISVYKLPHGH